jgi:hypothetical protein
MNLYLLLYISAILYITIPICKIIWQDKLDNDLLFLLCSNYILLLALSIINYQIDLIYSILLSLTLMIFSFLLIRKIKKIYNHYQLLSIPYFILTIYTFSFLLCLI